MKYHLNPFTGEPNKCNAKKRCPWGTPEDHFETLGEARMAYEVLQEAELFASFSRDLDAGDGENTDEHFVSLDFEVSEKSEDRKYFDEARARTLEVEGVRCKCGHALNAIQASLILNPCDSTSCHSCGEEIDLYNIRVEPTGPTAAVAQDKAQVYSLTWYHSSTAEDWEDSFDREYLSFEGARRTGFVAHLGSEQAAMDRQLSELYSSSKSTPGFWVYEVRVKPEATIADEVENDDNASYDIESNRMKDSNVVRYLNKWEDLASISLAARTSSLDVKAKRFVTYEEAIESPSLYNIDPKLALTEKRPLDL